jgi:ribosomal peptide maturation radical SAM protein 1
VDIREAGGKAGPHYLGEILEPADILLVVSPLAMTFAPLLGLHLLQASCREAGIGSRVFYANLLYSNLLGADLHRILSIDDRLFLGERLFAAAAFNDLSLSISRSSHKFADLLWVPDHLWQDIRHLENPGVPAPVVAFREWLGTLDLEYLVALTTDWLRALARQIVDIGFPIVGCSTAGGLVSAIALLHSIKSADPGVITLLGGACCEAEMAEGILSLGTDIDYIFSGEGEITFPGLARQILAGRLPGEKIVYGREVTDLDSGPLPDYRDYGQQREHFDPRWSSLNGSYWLPFETSRGCWYGKCTFCGVKGKRNVYRRRSPDTIIGHLKALVQRHGLDLILMNDIMMPSQYFETLLSRLSAEIPALKMFYEATAHLGLDQVLALRQAGVIEVQVGIESLSPTLLRRLAKPCTVQGNIALLRYARSTGIKIRWNILFGLPGDRISEYEEMLRLLPLIRHLEPPVQLVPLMLSRYSRYHSSPEAFGIANIRPAEVYRDILPPHADLDKIAYYFSADFPCQSRQNPAMINALWTEYQEWQRAWANYRKIPLEMFLPGFQVVRKSPDLYVLEDSRGLPGRQGRREINRHQAGLLLAARPLESVTDDDVRWALDSGGAVVMESWLIPLATAEPALILEFERASGSGSD